VQHFVQRYGRGRERPIQGVEAAAMRVLETYA